MEGFSGSGESRLSMGVVWCCDAEVLDVLSERVLFVVLRSLFAQEKRVVGCVCECDGDTKSELEIVEARRCSKILLLLDVSVVTRNVLEVQ